MNDKVKEFLKAKKEAQKKKQEEEKQKVLIGLGLSEKVYSPDNKYSKEFSISEWDNETSTSRWYKLEAVDVSDEEYQEIKNYSTNPIIYQDNPVAIALTVIAWIIFIAGFIAGIALGNVEVGTYYTHTEFSFAAALIYWAVALISGTMFLGFAEIIKLLDAIKNK